MDLIEANGGAGSRHPWETARLWFFHRMLRSVVARGQCIRVLDVGSGDAWFDRELAGAWRGCVDLVGVDPNYPEACLGERDGVRLVRGVPEGERFQGLLMLDVLEHVADDLGLLRTYVGHLDAGAWILVSVPAWPRLFSSHDRALHHVRRYTRKALRDCLMGAGLEPLSSGGLFTSLLPLRLATKAKEKVLGASPFRGAAWTGGAWITGLLHALLMADAWLCGAAARCRIPLPGLSWWALCRKP